MFKKLISSFFIFTLFFTLTSPVFALNKSEAEAEYVEQLPQDFPDKEGTAENEAGAVISSMEGSQSDISDALNTLDDRVKALKSDDPKKDGASDQLSTAKKSVNKFTGYEAKNNLHVIGGGPGSLPQILPSNSFQEAEKKAQTDMNKVNKALLAPTKPGNVPEGDILEDFLPQLIRQLFRFAWVAVLVALVISGVMFVMAFDNDERITKAKHMIYYTLIGFAAVTLAFAIVKAISDIDFFNFI